MSYGPVGMRGFGDLHGELVDNDAVSAPPVEDLSSGLADLHRIAQKYDGPNVENITPINLAPGKTSKIDFSTTPFNSLIFNVETGTLKVFIGDYQLQPQAVGHMTVPGGGAPVQYMFNTNGRILTLANDPASVATVLGTLIIERL